MSICITFNTFWNLSKICQAVSRQASESPQCWYWLFWVKTDVVSLLLSLMRQPSITGPVILCFSNIRLSGRQHLTRPLSPSPLYIVENIWSINRNECFSFSAQWSRSFKASWSACVKRNTILKEKPTPDESHFCPRFTRLIISNWICINMPDGSTNTNALALKSFIAV